MTVSKAEFSRANEVKGLGLIKRKKMSQGIELYISEGLRKAEAGMNEKHWLVTWALTRDEDVKEAQTIRFPFYARMPGSGIEVQTNQEGRILAAEGAANKWFKNAKQTGWL